MDRKDVKIIANYLPQYHRIPENDRWWGEGFTDWVAVKDATPLFAGHQQPRVPFDNNYYDLANPQSLAWQAELAKQHGIWGFGVYHYWFSSDQQLLTKPAENLLSHSEINIGYVLIWDNTSWIRTWSRNEGNDWAPAFDKDAPEEARRSADESTGLLARLQYGDRRDWKDHFEYLLPYFRDSRYMRLDGKPVFAVMNPQNDYDILKEMFSYWDDLARKEGLNGITPISKSRWKRRFFDWEFDYRPTSLNNRYDLFQYGLGNYLNRYRPHLRRYSYDRAWRNILHAAKKCTDPKKLFCGFVGYDDTPRRGEKARVFQGQTPQKFEYYLRQLLDISAKQNKEFVFLTAWNEWGEGAYLEPDVVNGFSYLDAVKSAYDKD